MIYDRKYIDIVNAKQIYSNKIQKFINLTAEEQEIVDRAFLNTTAINRITSAINKIWDLIVNMGGVKTEHEDVRQWGEQELFRLSNFSNIRENIGHIVGQLENISFVNAESYIELYNIINDEWIYTNLNNMEKLIYDIGVVLEQFAMQVEQKLYIFGAYNTILSEGVLTIE